MTKSLSRFSSSKLLGLQRSSPKKYLRLYKIITQPDILLFTLCLPESICSIHPVFHVSMLKPVISNSFPKRKQSALTLVIINRKSEYKISWIVDSKIDYRQACKLLYKVIWLEYKDIEDEFEQIPTSKLTHVSHLMSNFHIAYPAKSSSLPLF